MSSERTAWHPPFTTLLRERSPRWVRVSAEVPLTQEPLRADDLLEVRVDVPRDPDDQGRVLRGLWTHVTCVALLEFKSVSRPFRRGDLMRLIAYGHLWLCAHQPRSALTLAGGARRRACADDVTLALVVPTLSRALRREIDELGLTLLERDHGYHMVRGAFCTLVAVALDRASRTEHDELMAWFAGRAATTSVEARRWIRQNTSQVNAMDKASPELPGFDDWLTQFLESIPIEQRLAGIDPATRLAGIDPATRLAGIDPALRLADIDPAHQILALSDEALRAMPDSYFVTLPGDVQRALRARIGRPSPAR